MSDQKDTKDSESLGLGNMETSPSPLRKSKKRKLDQVEKSEKTQKTQFRNYFFTFNNYTKEDLERLRMWLSNRKCKYMFQEEKGTEGTPHLQGVVCFNSPVLKSLANEYLGWCESCKSVKHAVTYCSKLDTRNGQTWSRGFHVKQELKDFYDKTQEQPWQAEIIKIIKGDVCRRTVYWYWENTGNVGKSTLTRHLCINYGALLIGGSANDIYYAISQYVQEKGPGVPPIIIDLPRNQEHVSYTAMENLKNGMFFSSKYESGMCLFNPPHVIVLANVEPRKEKMSLDRWKIIPISGAPPHPP